MKRIEQSMKESEIRMSEKFKHHVAGNASSDCDKKNIAECKEQCVEMREMLKKMDSNFTVQMGHFVANFMKDNGELIATYTQPYLPVNQAEPSGNMNMLPSEGVCAAGAPGGGPHHATNSGGLQHVVPPQQQGTTTVVGGGQQQQHSGHENARASRQFPQNGKSSSPKPPSSWVSDPDEQWAWLYRVMEEARKKEQNVRILI